VLCASCVPVVLQGACPACGKAALLTACLQQFPLVLRSPPAVRPAPLVLQGACPNCGEVNTTYFGDILTVAGKLLGLCLSTL